MSIWYVYHTYCTYIHGKTPYTYIYTYMHIHKHTQILTCRICKKEYTGSTITRFRERFNQYKPNLKLYDERRRDFKQEKLWEHF